MTEPHSPGNNADNPVDTLYYDGACPICSAEIERLSQQRPDTLKTVDVHHIADADLPARRSELLRVLHLQRADGTWMKAADANVHAWQDTRWYWVIRGLRLPLIRPVVDWVYGLWANRRYKKLYGNRGMD